MSEFLSLGGLLRPEHLVTLLILLLVQGHLGLLNLLYVSMEARRVGPDQQRIVRRAGHGITMLMRLLVLAALVLSARDGAGWVASVDLGGLTATVSLFEILLIVGGIALVWISVREIFHLLLVDHLEHAEATQRRPLGPSLFASARHSAVFALASIMAGVALSDRLVLVAIAVVIVSVGMIWVSDHVTRFVEATRGPLVVGFIIGLPLAAVVWGLAADRAGISVLGAPVVGLNRPAFYVLAVLIMVTALGLRRYRAAMLDARADAARAGVPTTEPALARPMTPTADDTPVRD